MCNTVVKYSLYGKNRFIPILLSEFILNQQAARWDSFMILFIFVLHPKYMQ